MSAWKLKKGNGIAFYTIDHWLEAGVNIAFSTRLGGCSEGAFTSCNLGLHVGDEQDKVLTNREKFLENFQTELGQSVCCQQVHGDQVRRVDHQQQGRGAFLYETSLPECDGLITDEPSVTLLSFYADCLAIYFFDPQHRAVGFAHSGWKGTMNRIAEKTIATMQREFASQVKDLWVAIGPGIGPCCFEISPALADEVMVHFPGFENILQAKSVKQYWDLSATNHQMLLRQGVNPDHISICSLCTACNPHQLFSYRRDNGKTGRMGALLSLKY